jgi:Tat protein secretion system quality control protein TatD with DNase activity
MKVSPSVIRISLLNIIHIRERGRQGHVVHVFVSEKEYCIKKYEMGIFLGINTTIVEQTTYSRVPINMGGGYINFS